MHRLPVITLLFQSFSLRPFCLDVRTRYSACTPNPSQPLHAHSDRHCSSRFIIRRSIYLAGADQPVDPWVKLWSLTGGLAKYAPGCLYSVCALS
jgi:hypothetical protein